MHGERMPRSLKLRNFVACFLTLCAAVAAFVEQTYRAYDSGLEGDNDMPIAQAGTCSSSDLLSPTCLSSPGRADVEASSGALLMQSAAKVQLSLSHAERAQSAENATTPDVSEFVGEARRLADVAATSLDAGEAPPAHVEMQERKVGMPRRPLPQTPGRPTTIEGWPPVPSPGRVWQRLRSLAAGGLSSGSAALLALAAQRLQGTSTDSDAAIYVFIIIFALLVIFGLAVAVVSGLQEGNDKGHGGGADRGRLVGNPEDALLFPPPDDHGPVPRGLAGASRHAHQSRDLRQPMNPTSLSIAGRSDSRASSARDSIASAGALEPPQGNWPQAVRHFCPELVVPRGHEAVLAVPLLDHAALEVRDVEGKAVIRAELAPHGQLQAAPLVALHAAGPGGKRLAYCRPSAQGRTSVDIFDAHDERYGTLTKVATPTLLPGQWRGQDQPRHTAEPFRPCYVFAGGGANLLLTGSFAEHAVTVTNERRELLADTEPSPMAFDQSGVYYRLRVASNGDVGLVLSALLSIKVLEMR